MRRDLTIALMECYFISISENNIWQHNCLWAASYMITVTWMSRTGERVMISFAQEDRN